MIALIAGRPCKSPFFGTTKTREFQGLWKVLCVPVVTIPVLRGKHDVIFPLLVATAHPDQLLHEPSEGKGSDNSGTCRKGGFPNEKPQCCNRSLPQRFTGIPAV